MHSPPSGPPLEAVCAFHAALAELQGQHQQLTGFALAAAHKLGFSWSVLPFDEDTFEVIVRHSGGHEAKAIESSPAAAVEGLLGLFDLLADRPAPEPAPFQPSAGTGTAVAEAAASLAAATGGTVVEDEAEASARDPLDPLTDAEKAAAVAMVKAMDAEQRKAFTVAFRHAFRIGKEERTIIPTIQRFEHLDFIDRFTGEAAGLVRP